MIKEENIKLKLRIEIIEKENLSISEELKRFENGIGKKAEEDEN